MSLKSKIILFAFVLLRLINFTISFSPSLSLYLRLLFLIQLGWIDKFFEILERRNYKFWLCNHPHRWQGLEFNKKELKKKLWKFELFRIIILNDQPRPIPLLTQRQLTSNRIPRIGRLHLFYCTIDSLLKITEYGHALPLRQINQIRSAAIVILDRSWC